MAYGIWPWFMEKKWMDYSSILLAEPSRQPISGVITARLLISPIVQQCFSLVLIAATSWTNLQLEPEDTCTICWLWSECGMWNLYKKHKYFQFWNSHQRVCLRSSFSLYHSYIQVSSPYNLQEGPWVLSHAAMMASRPHVSPQSLY